MSIDTNENTPAGTVDLLVENLRPQAGDIVLVTVPPGVAPYAIRGQLEAMYRIIENHTGQKFPMIVLTEGMGLMTVNETKMREFGWVRPPGYVAPPQDHKH